MPNDCDVIIAGLGAMGSAAAYHLALSGRRVVGLDRLTPPHQFGSSHGLTRIIREAYFEHPLYVPLVQRAYELWVDLEKKSGRKLLLQTGGIMIGSPAGVVVRGARRSAEEHRLAHEVLTGPELRRRFPCFEPPEDVTGVWEPRAGILFPELAIQTHLDLAAQHGASFHWNEPVLKWEAGPEGVRVVTATRTYHGKQLLLSSGAWMSALLSDLQLPLKVERQVLFWFETRAPREQFQPGRCPIFLWEYAPDRFFYGFPDLGDGFKVALHHQGEETQPDDVRRDVDAHETEAIRELLRRFIPGALGALRSATVCLYTNTPDQHFVLDYHPFHPQVLIASPCSGHGFKFSPVIGEIAAQLLNGQPSPFDLALFKASRFR